MTEQTQVMNDPWASAENPQVRQAEYWGVAFIDSFFAVLEKGVGKIPFDPNTHSLDKRVTAIDIKIMPLPEINANFDIARSMIAESREWAAIVLPSIKALGVSPRELNGRFVHVGFKPTGRTYTNGQGETKENTTFEFLALFDNEDACRADYLSRNPSNGQTQSQPVQSSTATNDPAASERQTGLAFLRVIVENACKAAQTPADAKSTVAQNIVAYGAPVAKYFTVETPDAKALLTEAWIKVHPEQQNVANLF